MPANQRAAFGIVLNSVFKTNLGMELTRLTQLIHTSLLPSNWNLDKFFALLGELGQVHTLESGIDVGQGITVGPGKFVKNNKRRALNKRRA